MCLFVVCEGSVLNGIRLVFLVNMGRLLMMKVKL